MSLKGKIFYFINLEFVDGEKGDKLIIFLNNGNEKKDFLFLKTTSQNKYYDKQQVKGLGCFSEKNVFVHDGYPFSKKTYIEFNYKSIFIKSCEVILKKCMDGNLKEKGSLPNNIFNALINCFKNSPDYDKLIYDEL